MLVVSRWAEAVVAPVPELVQAASAATARPPTAIRDSRPARVNLIMLLAVGSARPEAQTVDTAANRHILTQPVANRISAVKGRRSIRPASVILASQQVNGVLLARRGGWSRGSPGAVPSVWDRITVPARAVRACRRCRRGRLHLALHCRGALPVCSAGARSRSGPGPIRAPLAGSAPYVTAG